MTKFAGDWLTKYTSVMLACLLLLASSPTLARVTAEVDRTDVALGETLRLILRSDNGEYPDEIDLTALERDFDILQRSSATSARIISGEQSVTRTLELELAPRREGLATIPSFDYGGLRTTPIAIKVAPEPNVAPDDALVTFDASVNVDTVYVQAQLILTVTLQQAINLDNRAVSELEIPNAYVEALEQRSFQRRVGGRLWQVTELRYALFPQQSGQLEIPSLAFSGRELLPGRSLLGARLGRRIALKTDPINVTVKPVPSTFPGEVWLPARALTLTSQWSKDPSALAIGDSTTRTLEITAEGLQGSQLPPITSLAQRDQTGLRFYPDQETIEQRELGSGLQGYRLQSEALVATDSGRWTLPELSIPWWNTDTDQLEYARLPAVEVQVGGAAPTATDTQGPYPIELTPEQLTRAAPTGWLWPALAASGWLLAALLGALLIRRRRGAALSDAQTPAGSGRPMSSRELIPLRLACTQNDPRAARDALIHWGRAYVGNNTITSLTTLAAEVDPALASEIRDLDAALYSDGQNTWRGDDLFKQVRAQGERRAAPKEQTLTLYPST